MAIIKKFLYPLFQGSVLFTLSTKGSGVVTFSSQFPQGYNENACVLHFLLVHALWHEAG